MTFKLKIELGTRGMHHPLDVAMALRSLASSIEHSDGFPGGGDVLDFDGNKVGEWEAKA